MIKTNDKIENIEVEKIEITDRVRAVDPAAVETIKTSISDVGFVTTPVHVRADGKRFILIDGAHRCQAALELGLKTVPARVWRCTVNEAKFIEVDANLAIAHRKPLDVALSLAARKKAYEALHPQTRRGHAGAAGRHLQLTEMSFADYLAKVLGLSSRQAFRMLAAGMAVGPKEAELLRAANRQISWADLEAIQKISDRDIRTAAIETFANGDAKSLKLALKAHSTTPSKPTLSPEDAQHKALKDAFKRASKTARKRFVTDYLDELRTLLDEVAE